MILRLWFIPSRSYTQWLRPRFESLSLSWLYFIVSSMIFYFYRLSAPSHRLTEEEKLKCNVKKVPFLLFFIWLQLYNFNLSFSLFCRIHQFLLSWDGLICACQFFTQCRGQREFIALKSPGLGLTFASMSFHSIFYTRSETTYIIHVKEVDGYWFFLTTQNWAISLSSS